MNIQHEIIEPDFTVHRFNSFSIRWHHWHQRMEIVYIKKGSCNIKISNKNYSAESGDIIFIHSGEIHSYSSCSEDIDVLIFTFNPSIIYQLKSESGYINNHITNDMLKSSEGAMKIKQLFEEIYDENEKGLYLSKNIIISNLLCLYSLLARHFQNPIMAEKKNLSKFQAFQKAHEQRFLLFFL